MNHGGIEGTARLRLALTEGRPVLAGLFQKAPLRFLFPRPEPGEPLCAVLLNTAGGIVGGDLLRVEVRLDAGVEALITSQAAEKVYRSAGPTAVLEIRLDVATGGRLEWLPQETILFEGARLRRRLQVDLAAGASLLAAEMLVFGRRARGEQFRSGLLRDRWEVRVEGRLVFADALDLGETPGAALDAPFGFAAAGAFASAVYVAPDAAARLDLARALVERPAVRAGVTCLGPLLVLRWLGGEPAAVRDAVQTFCLRFRHVVGCRPERLPALWRG